MFDFFLKSNSLDQKTGFLRSENGRRDQEFAFRVWPLKLNRLINNISNVFAYDCFYIIYSMRFYVCKYTEFMLTYHFMYE